MSLVRSLQLLAAVAVALLAYALVANPASNARAQRWAGYWDVLAHRLAGYPPEYQQPTFHTDIDVGWFQRAAKILQPGSVYTIQPKDSTGLVATDVYSAARIYFPWGVPVVEARDADWIISIDHPPRMPRASKTLHRFVLGDRAVLVQIGPR